MNKHTKTFKIIGLAMISAGLIVLFALVYTDAYTALKQVMLREQWQAPAKNVQAVSNSRRLNTPKNKSLSRSPAKPVVSKEETGTAPKKHIKIKLGSPFARIVIPRIELDAIVVEGVDQPQLALGPGHMEDTPWPGEPGNMVISGHRVTHSHPFYYIDRLKIGDPIIIYTKSQNFVYGVIEKKIVLSTDLSVIKPTKNAVLTLTTCNPRFSAKTRLIIHAKMRRTATGN